MTLILSVLALATGLAVTEARAQDLAEEVRQPVTLARWALRHIQQRHWPDSPAQGAGKFAPDITEESLRNMINEAVTNGRSRQNSHGRPGGNLRIRFWSPDRHHKQWQLGEPSEGGYQYTQTSCYGISFLNIRIIIVCAWIFVFLKTWTKSWGI
jgi:hypothetical protein